MYEQAKKTPDLMKGFVNTVLGLPFEEEAEAPEWQRLYERREAWRIGLVPEPGLFLTAGVDVQKDRIEVEVVAWGRGKESWSVLADHCCAPAGLLLNSHSWLNRFSKKLLLHFVGVVVQVTSRPLVMVSPPLPVP
jgi:hypothetical protein